MLTNFKNKSAKYASFPIGEQELFYDGPETLLGGTFSSSQARCLALGLAVIALANLIAKKGSRLPVGASVVARRQYDLAANLL